MIIIIALTILFLIYLVFTIMETNKICRSNSDKLDKILKLQNDRVDQQ